MKCMNILKVQLNTGSCVKNKHSLHINITKIPANCLTDSVVTLNKTLDKIANKEQILVWWAFWDDKWRRIICRNYAAFCSSAWNSILLQSFDRENKSESASVQQRAICLGQLLNWDNKPPPFKLTLKWRKKQKQTRNLLDCIFLSNRKRFIWCHGHFF